MILNLLMLPAAFGLLRSVGAFRRRVKETRDEELAALSRRPDLAMEASNIGFWDVDLDTDALCSNARACQHMGVELRPGGHFTEADGMAAVHPDDRTRAGAAAEAMIAAGGRFISDYRVVWPSGEIRHIIAVPTVRCDWSDCSGT